MRHVSQLSCNHTPHADARLESQCGRMGGGARGDDRLDHDPPGPFVELDSSQNTVMYSRVRSEEIRVTYSLIASGIPLAVGIYLVCLIVSRRDVREPGT